MGREPRGGGSVFTLEKRFGRSGYKAAAEKTKRSRQLFADRKIAEKRRSSAVSMVAKAISSGKLVRGRCEVCGDIKSEGHHENYDRPLDVRWLCKKHHTERHVQMRAELKEK